METPRSFIEAYTKKLNALSSKARKQLERDLMRIDYTLPVAEVRELVIDRMEFYCSPYTDMAAELAADFYDELREKSVGEGLGALVEPGREPVATEKAVRAIMQELVVGKAAEVVVGKLLDRIDFEIKRAAGECVYRNGKRDPLKPKYARVPSGTETCKFCIMLASRGFEYRNEKTAGADGHYHPNCDCRIVPGFGKNPSVEGYDREAYYEQYREMLKGHELESHYDLMTRNGKTTKRLYKTASYDYGAAIKSNGKPKKGTASRSKGVKLEKSEYAMVTSAINTNYNARFKGKKKCYIPVDKHVYEFEVVEFGEYRITRRYPIDGE